MAKRTPSDRPRKGYDQAIVTLSDSHTKERCDFWLGKYDSPESRQCYHSLIAEWEANGRRLAGLDDDFVGSSQEDVSFDKLTIAELNHKYWAFAKDDYRPSEAGSLKIALRLLRQYFGETPGEEIGPETLRFLRERMLETDRASTPFESWTRGYINQQIKRIRRMFK